MTSPVPVSLLVQVPGRFSLYIKYISGDDVPCPTSPIQLWLALPILILALSFNFIIMFRTGWLFLAQINGLSCLSSLSCDKHKPVKQHGIVLWEGPAHCAQVSTIQSRNGFLPWSEIRVQSRKDRRGLHSNTPPNSRRKKESMRLGFNRKGRC